MGLLSRGYGFYQAVENSLHSTKSVYHGLPFIFLCYFLFTSFQTYKKNPLLFTAVHGVQRVPFFFRYYSFEFCYFGSLHFSFVSESIILVLYPFSFEMFLREQDFGLFP